MLPERVNYTVSVQFMFTSSNYLFFHGELRTDQLSRASPYLCTCTYNKEENTRAKKHDVSEGGDK